MDSDDAGVGNDTEYHLRILYVEKNILLWLRTQKTIFDILMALFLNWNPTFDHDVTILL